MTGVCDRCVNNITHGVTCDSCVDGYYGDPSANEPCIRKYMLEASLCTESIMVALLFCSL